MKHRPDKSCYSHSEVQHPSRTSFEKQDGGTIAPARGSASCREHQEKPTIADSTRASFRTI